MLISAICMGALSDRSYHSIHVSSIFRAAVAETLAATDYSGVMKCNGPVIIPHYPDQVTYGQSYHNEIPVHGQNEKEKKKATNVI